MGRYIWIEKSFEDEQFVIYRYGTIYDQKNIFEELRIEKGNQDINHIKCILEIDEISHYTFLTAAVKIWRHNEQNPDDLFPDQLVYASG